VPATAFPDASVIVKVLLLMVVESIASLNWTSCIRFGATPFVCKPTAVTVERDRFRSDWSDSWDRRPHRYLFL
jgi:hypothetical protein